MRPRKLMDRLYGTEPHNTRSNRVEGICLLTADNHFLWLHGQKVTTQPFQGWSVGFKSHWGHCLINSILTGMYSGVAKRQGSALIRRNMSVQVRPPPLLMCVWQGAGTVCKTVLWRFNSACALFRKIPEKNKQMIFVYAYISSTGIPVGACDRSIFGWSHRWGGFSCKSQKK